MGSPHRLTGRCRRAAGELLVDLSAGWLMVLAMLGTIAVTPTLTLTGWRAMLVSSDSMRPALTAGDVVLVDDDLPADRSPVGTVLLVDRPGGDPHLLHRVVDVSGDGTLLMRGDANDAPDTDLVRPGQVLGMGRLVVPAAGRVLLARRLQTPADLAWLGGTAFSGVVVMTAGLLAPRRRTAGDEPDGNDRADDTDDTDDTGEPPARPPARHAVSGYRPAWRRPSMPGQARHSR